MIYYFVGLLMCITIIGIPFGIQLFKLGHAAFQDGDWLHFPVGPSTLIFTMELNKIER